MASRKPGDTIEALVLRGKREERVSLTPRVDPHTEIATLESAGRTLTAEQQRFRAAWLGSKVRRAAAAGAVTR